MVRPCPLDSGLGFDVAPVAPLLAHQLLLFGSERLLALGGAPGIEVRDCFLILLCRPSDSGRATLSERGWPPRFGFRVDLLCPHDAPRVCRGTVAVAGEQGLTPRTPFAVARQDLGYSVHFRVSESDWGHLDEKVRVIVRSRDRAGRHRSAQGIFQDRTRPCPDSRFTRRRWPISAATVTCRHVHNP